MRKDSDTMLAKESGESYKNNQPICVQIFKKFSLRKSLNVN